METKFQTSFIPRKTIPSSSPGGMIAAPARSHRDSSAFMMISSAIFVISLLSIGGAFLWKQYLVNSQAEFKHQLAVQEQKFNIDLIRQLKAQSSKISLAKQLLNGHVATSKFFSILSSLTAENVRFTSLDLSTSADSPGTYEVGLAGYARDLTTVAFQAKVLNKLGDFGIRDIIRNPIVADPVFNQNGSVSFKLTAAVDAVNLLYQVAPMAGETASSSQAQ